MAKLNKSLLFGLLLLALVALAGVAFRVAFVSLLVALAAGGTAAGLAWWAWRRIGRDPDRRVGQAAPEQIDRRS